MRNSEQSSICILLLLYNNVQKLVAAVDGRKGLILRQYHWVFYSLSLLLLYKQDFVRVLQSNNFQTQKYMLMLSPASEASREVANLT